MTFNAGIEAAALKPCSFCGSTNVNTGFQRAMHRYASRSEAGPEIDAARRFLNAGKE